MPETLRRVWARSLFEPSLDTSYLHSTDIGYKHFDLWTHTHHPPRGEAHGLRTRKITLPVSDADQEKTRLGITVFAATDDKHAWMGVPVGLEDVDRQERARHQRAFDNMERLLFSRYNEEVRSNEVHNPYKQQLYKRSEADISAASKAATLTHLSTKRRRLIERQLQQITTVSEGDFARGSVHYDSLSGRRLRYLGNGKYRNLRDESTGLAFSSLPPSSPSPPRKRGGGGGAGVVSSSSAPLFAVKEAEDEEVRERQKQHTEEALPLNTAYIQDYKQQQQERTMLPLSTLRVSQGGLVSVTDGLEDQSPAAQQRHLLHRTSFRETFAPVANLHQPTRASSTHPQSPTRSRSSYWQQLKETSVQQLDATFNGDNDAGGQSVLADFARIHRNKQARNKSLRRQRQRQHYRNIYTWLPQPLLAGALQQHHYQDLPALDYDLPADSVFDPKHSSLDDADDEATRTHSNYASDVDSHSLSVSRLGSDKGHDDRSSADLRHDLSLISSRPPRHLQFVDMQNSPSRQEATSGFLTLSEVDHEDDTTLSRDTFSRLSPDNNRDRGQETGDKSFVSRTAFAQEDQPWDRSRDSLHSLRSFEGFMASTTIPGTLPQSTRPKQRNLSPHSSFKKQQPHHKRSDSQSIYAEEESEIDHEEDARDSGLKVSSYLTIPYKNHGTKHRKFQHRPHFLGHYLARDAQIHTMTRTSSHSSDDNHSDHSDDDDDDNHSDTRRGVFESRQQQRRRRQQTQSTSRPQPQTMMLGSALESSQQLHSSTTSAKKSKKLATTSTTSATLKTKTSNVLVTTNEEYAHAQAYTGRALHPSPWA